MRRVKKPAYHPWEYKFESFQTSATNNPVLTARFNQAGDDEWELVSYDFTQARAVFKRRKEIHNKSDGIQVGGTDAPARPPRR